jgi:cyanophycinase
VTGPVALVGSGEYLPVMAPVEAMLLEGRPPLFVQLPTAAALEGEASLSRWVSLGRTQADRLGVTAVPVLVRDRRDAESTELAALIDGAGLVYLSGGNPAHLAETLRGTRVWAAIRETWEAGAALAGCSAGAIALTSWVPHLRNPLRAPDPGLDVVPHVRVIPHFDKFLGWMPDLVDRFLAKAPPGVTVLGIDEDTALVGDAGTWTVHGRQSVWVISAESRLGYSAGKVVAL